MRQHTPLDLTTDMEVPVLLSISEPTLRLTRRSLLISSASAAALLASPGSRFGSFALAAQGSVATTGVFFDAAELHTISATFDEAEYDAMIATFRDTGDKEWISATATIDGQTYEEVGIRLKGNSSLMALRGSGGFQAPDNGQNAQPAGAGMTEDIIGPSSPLSADEPEGLPWLVRLDKFVDDQNLNGLTEFVIRSNNSATALNEALALDLLAAAGLASQAAAYVSFSVNESTPRLRIAIENPDDTWMDAHFAADGLLFKSESDGN